MNGTPVVSLRRIWDKQHGTRWRIIIRGAIYHEARLVTYTTFLGQALAVAEAHLRLWGYNDIEASKAIANAHRNIRRRYGPGIIDEEVQREREAAEKQIEPYPD